MAKAVDRLELVADREQVVALQRGEDRELARVGVLELVDHQQLVALRPCAADGLALGQQQPCAQLQVVEVDGPAVALELLVAPSERLQQHVDQGARSDSLALGALVALRARRPARSPQPAGAAGARHGCADARGPIRRSPAARRTRTPRRDRPQRSARPRGTRASPTRTRANAAAQRFPRRGSRSPGRVPRPAGGRAGAERRSRERFRQTPPRRRAPPRARRAPAAARARARGARPQRAR